MRASEVISTLQRRGVTLKIVAGSLKIGGVNQLTDREKAALKAHKASIIEDLSQPTATTAGVPVATALAVTAALPTYTEPPELEPKDRLCYQCASFTRSPYGFPLGLCQQHGDRIQHSTSQPTRFGCGDFMLRQSGDDSRTCLACRHYSQQSTMCDAVNVGCPYPAIPPCSGAHFEPVEVAK